MNNKLDREWRLTEDFKDEIWSSRLRDFTAFWLNYYAINFTAFEQQYKTLQISNSIAVNNMGWRPKNLDNKDY